ncbi:hypothetical protein ATANTOWER_001662, partial [Ataeniobius toweri]|nr:hypothetical protein [Ataeniobius toweri]
EFWKLQPRCPSPELPLCFQLQTKLLRSRLNLTINLPAHPPTLTLQSLWSFLEEKKHKKKQSNSPSKTVHCLSASSHHGKTNLLLPPALPRTQPLEIPILLAAPVLVPVRP